MRFAHKVGVSNPLPLAEKQYVAIAAWQRVVCLRPAQVGGVQVDVKRYKKGRPHSGRSKEESLEQPFNVDALNTEGGVQ